MPKYDYERFAQLVNSLSRQQPTSEQVTRIEHLRNEAISFASEILAGTQKSREQSLAFTHLEETLMWAVKAIVLEDVE